MYVINARNVHCALPKALEHLGIVGVRRESRNGPTLVSPEPVATVYERPMERLTFWPQRDVNVAFLLAEALWMLDGRNDLALPQQYVKTFDRYSDDGKTLHGAYGYRWRNQFGSDQLVTIVSLLRRNKDDRRAVLQMWNTDDDLGRAGKDVPCNLTATFQRDAGGRLDMVVFCRSNDILWGAYFANAFHFSVLQEYLARWIGCEVGRYTQVSVNWHAYIDRLADVDGLKTYALDRLYAVPASIPDPYDRQSRLGFVVTPCPMTFHQDEVEAFDESVRCLLTYASTGLETTLSMAPLASTDPFITAAVAVLRAHRAYTSESGASRFASAYQALASAPAHADMVKAMRWWLERREQKAMEAGR